MLGQYPHAALPAELNYYPANLTFEECSRLGSLHGRLVNALDDDLNTAQALGFLFDTIRLLNRLPEEQSSEPGYLTILFNLHQGIKELGKVLNLLQSDPAAMVKSLRQKPLDLGISPEEIERLIAGRTQARKDRNYAKADSIRKDLLEKGILLEDTPQGTIWRVK